MVGFDANRLLQIERVNIIGTSGSGKSTFGRQLSKLLGLPFIEMDSLYWGPNWTERPDEEFLAKVEASTEPARWVLDGNYQRTTPIKWRHVQLVIWIDLSLVRTLYRVASRSLKRSINKTEIWPSTGNCETFRKSFFSRQSVILWANSSYKANRKTFCEMMESREYEHIWFMRLGSKRAVESFLDAVRVAAERRDGSAPVKETAR